ncbi:MAG: fumarylacetoacetate hydrolase family protein [Silvibacterium sp.]|nr:fumarylacetoacetate hydrolase family protein [Silvibacterium sp.]
MKLYRCQGRMLVEEKGKYYPVEESLDTLVALEDLYLRLQSIVSSSAPIAPAKALVFEAPIEHQEVWAAGVTYYRSRSARIEESKDAGGGDFYDRVYSAERPELFYKAMAHKVAGPDARVRIRSDAKWSVPEPELALLINARGRIIGYTIGNDMSSRDIEGENPLYLPQAKVYDQSCALGPGILIQPDPMPPSTRIRMEILRSGVAEFSGATTLSEMKRDPPVLVEYLFRDQSFPFGCFLLTGTGIVPPDHFSLRSADEVHISIDGIGTLVNQVA